MNILSVRRFLTLQVIVRMEAEIYSEMVVTPARVCVAINHGARGSVVG